MTRVARERIVTLFALAQQEAVVDRLPLSDRYVALARRIGARYNVRLPPEYRELYCRGCSRFWVEGRTVRTRLRRGRRIRTCLTCGRVRRVPSRRTGGGIDGSRPAEPAIAPVPMAEAGGVGDDLGDDADGSEEE